MFSKVHVDFGTGDGAFAYWTARHQPGDLVIGVDANGASLLDVSRKASRKPARGGLSNVMFGRVSLEDAPGESGSHSSNLIQVRQIQLYPVLHVDKLEIREYRDANLSNRALVQTCGFSSPVG